MTANNPRDEGQAAYLNVDEVKNYDPRPANYALSADPRCLWGWGDCGCRFGHGCFRPLGHRGKCWDAGDSPKAGDRPCHQRQRPKDWDAKGRAEANA